MAPSFYSPSISFSNLLSSSSSLQSHQTTATDNSLPTLAVVLGLIGVLIGLALIASVCIYMFRARLFPRAEPAQDQEKVPFREQQDFDHSSRSSIHSHDTAVCFYETEEHLVNGPVLRPLLLNPTKSTRSRIKALLLPRFLRKQSYKAIKQDQQDAATKRRSFPYHFGRGSISARCGGDEAAANSMKASQSCPARLSLEPNGLTSNDATEFFQSNEGKFERKLKDLKLVNKLSLPPPPRPSLISSYESKDSVYSDDDCSSCSSGSVDWDYYINDDHEGLFYDPPDELPPSVTQTFTLRSGPRLNRHLPLSKRTKLGNSKKYIRRCFDFSLALRFRLSRALKVYRLRNRAPRSATLRLPEETLREGCIDDLGFIVNSQVHELSSRRNSSLDCDSDSCPYSADIFLRSLPLRSSSRQELNVSTDASPSSSETQLPEEDRLEIPKFTRPLLLLNDVPADDLIKMSPPRFTCHRSPPRNPALLNTRWTPRPAIPPLSLTVFAKHVSLPRHLSSFSTSAAATAASAMSKYPGRRVTITTPAGTSLAELRSLVERALLYDDRDGQDGDDRRGRRKGRLVSLRGMVFVGTRTLFLPLATERFYAQWVKERVKEGGCGIIEAWHD